jgi:hypothetical protein
MHGNRANLVLFENGKAIELFRNHLTTDAEIKLQELNRTIDWSNEEFEQNIHELHKHYFTFGKAVWNFLNRNNFDEKSDVEKWQAITRSYHLPIWKSLTYYLTEVESTSFYLSPLP